MATETQIADAGGTPTICVETPSCDITRTNAPTIASKRSYRHLGKKDEPHILKGLKAFKPLYIIANELGVDRHTLYHYLRDNMDISYKNMRESMIDVAESKLLKNVVDGNQNAIEFLLDRLGKNRGYGIKEIADRNDVPIINIGKIEMKQDDGNSQVKEQTIEAEIIEGKKDE